MDEEQTRVVIETEKGDITIDLEDERAPGTVPNFLGYVDAGMYDGGRFHRVVQMDNQHRDGVISMARFGPDSAVSDFFTRIRIGEQPELNFGGQCNPDGQGFAAFGQITDGMDVVRRIQGGPTDGQALIAPVRIIRIRRTPS
jgi:peptidyl-prolyl cis-trans isomerase A (cyclophilin A)